MSAAKEKAIADKGKGKGGRKRKSLAPEAEAISSVPKKKVVQMSEQMSEILELAKAYDHPWNKFNNTFLIL